MCESTCLEDLRSEDPGLPENPAAKPAESLPALAVRGGRMRGRRASGLLSVCEAVLDAPLRSRVLLTALLPGMHHSQGSCLECSY